MEWEGLEGNGYINTLVRCSSHSDTYSALEELKGVGGWGCIMTSGLACRSFSLKVIRSSGTFPCVESGVRVRQLLILGLLSFYPLLSFFLCPLCLRIENLSIGLYRTKVPSFAIS